MSLKNNELKLKIIPKKIFFPKGLNATMEEEGFAIFVADVIDSFDSGYQDYSIKLKGKSCSLNPKFNYIVNCELKEKGNQFGDTYEIISIRTDVKMDNLDDVKEFLTMIIGEKRTNSLIEKYSDDLIDILDNGDVDKLCQVKGIKETSARKILSKYEETKDYSLLIAKTKQLGLDFSIKTIKKLLAIFGNEEKILKMLRENPYELSRYVDGFGFKKCDKLALSVGIGEYSPLRVKKAITYLLEESGAKGIEYPSYTELLSELYKLIGYIPEQPLNQACQELIQEGEVILLNNGEFIASKHYYDIEKRISKEIERIGSTKDSEIIEKLNNIDLENEILISENNLGFKLAEQQLDSIRAVKSNKNILITVGGAGSGKSSSSKALLEILDRANLNIACCSFTGKASLRITEATGFPASTIHRLLGFNPRGGFIYNKQNKLPYDVILIDETGMLSAELFLWLTEAIKDGAILIILGDTRQLTSITSGNILSDLLNANVNYISKTILTKIQRQKNGSNLLDYIQTVLDQNKLIGSTFVGRKQFGDEVTLDIFTETGEYVLDWISKEYLTKLEKYNNDLFSVVIMSPTRLRGNLSLYKINSKIKSLINPFDENKPYFYKHLGKNEEGSFGYNIQEGDKVIVTKNLYGIITVDDTQTDVFNGNMGIVTMITDNIVSVKMETGDEVILSRKNDEAENLLLGYANTVHQMQGSECACAIMCIDNASYVMANNEILYTGISRAKKELTVFAQNYTYRQCVTTREQKTKRCLLVKFLNREID